VLQADKSAFKAKKIGINGGKNAGFKTSKDMSLETIDFNKKILHGSWHPRENTIAVRVLCMICTHHFLICCVLKIAATNNLFLVRQIPCYYFVVLTSQQYSAA
jgi:hypothetical protein